MRCLRFLLMGGMVLALSVQAWGTTIPFSGSYNGPLYMHMQNFDDSVVYDYNGGFLADGTTPITLNQAYDVSLVKTWAALNTMQGESAWGIFSVEYIADAVVDPNSANRINLLGSNLFVDGDQGIELVGIFSGGVDQQVVFTQSPFGTPGDTQTIVGGGYDIKFYAQPKTDVDNGILGYDYGAGGALARTALGNYPTIGFDASDNPLPNSTLVLELSSQPGIEAQEFLSTFIPDASGSGNGSFNFYASVTGGTMQTIFDTNIFPCGSAVPSILGTTADVRFEGKSTPADPNLWLVHSSDPITLANVPEPITMAGLLMGIGCLGRYIRRRR